MADIVQTPANVLAAVNTPTRDGIAGATIVAGDALYKDSTDGNKLKLAIDTPVASAAAVGVALNGGASGQPIRYQTGGDHNPGGTVAIGETYFVSSNAGKFAPDADVLAGKFRTTLGIGTTASNIKLAISVGGVAVA